MGFDSPNYLYRIAADLTEAGRVSKKDHGYFPAGDTPAQDEGQEQEATEDPVAA
jgi:hypothetical protein